jgi:flagellar biosynthesis/type III secretory pathway M-ring protein FliF/YscJ
VILAEIKRLNSQADWEKFSKGGGWLYFAVALVVVVVLFGFVLKIREWMRPKGLPENSAENLLLQFRDIHQQGDLSAKEYKRIRERLANKSGGSGRAEDASRGPSTDDSAGTSPATHV